MCVSVSVSVCVCLCVCLSVCLSVCLCADRARVRVHLKLGVRSACLGTPEVDVAHVSVPHGHLHALVLRVPEGVADAELLEGDGARGGALRAADAEAPCARGEQRLGGGCGDEGRRSRARAAREGGVLELPEVGPQLWGHRWIRSRSRRAPSAGDGEALRGRGPRSCVAAKRAQAGESLAHVQQKQNEYEKRRSNSLAYLPAASSLATARAVGRGSWSRVGMSRPKKRTGA